MIIINKEEAAIVRERLPHTCLSIASKRKRSNGKTYYMEENYESMKLICKLRRVKYVPRKYFY